MGLYDYLGGWFARTSGSIHPIDRCENRVLEDILDKMGMISLVEWRKPEEKPKIPEGRYAVSVLMITYDPVYDEINPGKGWDVHNGLYGSTNIKGVKLNSFKNINRDFDFMELYIGKDWEYGPVCDRIVYWAYVPEMVNGKLVR